MDIAMWKVDEVHSSIHFGVRHMAVATLRGQFRRWTAELTMDEKELTASSVAITMDAASVDTGNAERDASLRSPRFFDTEQFPSITFQSSRVERAAKDSYRIRGNLTIRGVTKEIELEMEAGGFVTDSRGVRRAGFTARGSVLRGHFGMVFNQVLEAGGVAIGDRVEILLEVEAMAMAAKAA
jgi:polyisoprenoid-binding protein YceI